MLKQLLAISCGSQTHGNHQMASELTFRKVPSFLNKSFYPVFKNKIIVIIVKVSQMVLGKWKWTKCYGLCINNTDK